jgi:hypothetical protein
MLLKHNKKDKQARQLLKRAYYLEHIKKLQQQTMPKNSPANLYPKPIRPGVKRSIPGKSKQKLGISLPKPPVPGIPDPMKKR